MTALARIIVSVALVASSLSHLGLAKPQFGGDPSLARILQEQRFNAGSGKFGSAFAQEDGVVYREESVGNNERVGQYSYIGDDGKTYTVKYSAGVNGFRILGGDHIPSGGQNSADAITVNQAGSPRSTTMSTMTTPSPRAPSSIHTTLRTSSRTSWMVTWLVCWPGGSSPRPAPRPPVSPPPPDQTDSSPRVRSSSTDSQRDLTLTSSHSRLVYQQTNNTILCKKVKLVQSL